MCIRDRLLTEVGYPWFEEYARRAVSRQTIAGRKSAETNHEKLSTNVVKIHSEPDLEPLVIDGLNPESFSEITL